MFDPIALDFAIKATAVIISESMVTTKSEIPEEPKREVNIRVTRQEPRIIPQVPGPEPGYGHPRIENTEQYCPNVKPGTICPLIFTDPRYNAELRLG